MSKKYLNNDDFDSSSAQSTGGVTGSKRVKLGEDYYQLKPSILDNTFIRKTKAGRLDIENFGEIISAAVSRTVTNSDSQGQTELVPEVSLVYDATNKRVLIASKYLDRVEGDLNSYAKKQGIDFQGRFVNISAKRVDEKQLNFGGDGEDNKILRQDLATAIAVSAFSGDHDVNPTNMLALKDTQGRTRIARIDFGHAFNDLINAPKQFGGQLRNKNNQILDFLNREQVAQIINDEDRRRSKLWNSYSGIIPSEELANALKNIAESGRVKEGLDNAKNSFKDLISELELDPKSNKKTLDHVKNSLVSISNNVSETKLDARKLDVSDALEKSFNNLGEYYKKNQGQMRDVAKLIQMQADIDKVIVTKKDGKEPDKELVSRINKSYSELEKVSGISFGDSGIEWAKTSKDVGAFKGDLNNYVRLRAASLGVKIKGIDNLSPKAPLVVKDDYSLLAKFLKDSVELYSQQRHPINPKDLEQKFNELLLKQVNSAEQTEITLALTQNMKHYVSHMDKEMTGLRNEKLSDYPGKNSEEIKIAATNSIMLKSSFYQTSKSLEKLGEKWFDKAADTGWKKAATLFSALKMKEIAQWCLEKNKEAKIKLAAENIGIPLKKILNREANSALIKPVKPVKSIER
jgi:hypothetical protein